MARPILSLILFFASLLWTGADLAAQQCGPGGCPDQQAASDKLNLMVQNNILNRHVPPLLGRFEGIGYSSSPLNIPTCTPRQKMTLTADVVQRSRNGLWVRMRVWR